MVKSAYDDEDARLLYESAPSGTGATHEYVWIGDRLVTEFSGASTFSAFTDHLATPTILTNSSGAVAWQADFEPFGKVYALRTADMHQPVRRLGQIATQFDDGAGPDGDSMLEYNHARWYNPAWGSYTQPEPMSAMGQTEPYTYVEVDPYSKTDQTGNCYVQAFYDEPNYRGVPVPGLFHETIVVSPSNYAGDIPITRDSQGRTVVPAFYSGTPDIDFSYVSCLGRMDFISASVLKLQALQRRPATSNHQTSSR